MTSDERKEAVRTSILTAKDDVIKNCPDSHARRIAQISLQQALRFALLAIDQAKTEPQVLVPGALKRTC